MSLAYLGGAPSDTPPPATQNFLKFIQFLGRFDKLVCWRLTRWVGNETNVATNEDKVHFIKKHLQ